MNCENEVSLVRIHSILRNCGASGFLILCLIFSIIACRATVPHPPGFADFQRAFRRGSDTQAGFESLLSVLGAAELTPEEMQTILNGTNVEAMIGAGLQGRLGDAMTMTLLVHATTLSTNNPVAWAALAYRSLAIVDNRSANPEFAAKVFRKSVQVWRNLAPSNAAPLYLEAAFACLNTNVARAKSLAAKASRKPQFAPYRIQLDLRIVCALESAGYSSYTARVIASANGLGIAAWAKLNKTLLAAAPSPEDIRACLKLGHRVASGSTLVEQLVGESLELKALARLKGPDVTTRRKQIVQDRKRTKRAIAFLNSARTRNLSEAQWVQYYDRFFKQGEMAAVRWLAEQTGDTF